MTQALTESPFVSNRVDDVPWTVWKKREPVIDLEERKQTDRRSELREFDEATSASPQQTMPVSQQINRRQYQSVLERMNQACGKAGTYSAWTPSGT